MEGPFPNMTNSADADTLDASFGASSDTSWQPVSWSSIHHTPQGSTLTLPAGEKFLSADFSRTASDLLIETPSGAHFVVENFFTFAYPPALETAHGAILTAELLTTLAGPLAPNMVAQLGQVGQAQVNTLGAPIGQVNESEGQVTVTHADGAQETLTLGASIYQGDVLETGPKANTSVVFVDDTIFTLSENGRIVMDEMVYDPGSQTGIFSAQIVQGVFSFVSGKIAKTSPDAMVLSTPTNTIGVRGSTLLGEAAPDGQPNSITLITDVDGNVGELVISNGGGTMVLNQAGASTTIFSATVAPAPLFFLAPQAIQQNYGATLTNLVKAVAQKAEQDTQDAARQSQKADQDAAQAQQDADAAQQQAKQAGEQAEQSQADADQAQIDADAVKADAENLTAEAETAKADAEALGDAEAIAKAEALQVQADEAQALAEEAQAQADAEGTQAAEAQQQADAAALQAQAQGDVADQAQQDADQAQIQAEQTAQFSTLAQSAAVTQQQVFTQFVQTGFVDPAYTVGAASQDILAQMADVILKGPTGEDPPPPPPPDPIIDLVALDIISGIIIDMPPPLPLPLLPPPPPLDPIIIKTLNTTSTFNEILIASLGNDHLVGGPGNTQFTMNQGTTLGGNDTIDGGVGTDEITFTNLHNIQMVLDMSTKIATYSNSDQTITGTIALNSIEQVFASDGSAARQRINMTETDNGFGYILSGTTGGDSLSVATGQTLSYLTTNPIGQTPAAISTFGSIIFGGAGDDAIAGSAQSDIIFGGVGNDTITGGGDSDSLYGGAGADIFKYNAIFDGGLPGDAISDFSGATAFGSGGGDGDKIQFTNAFSLGTIIYEEIIWDGTATALTLSNVAANIIVLTGGTAGGLSNALTALVGAAATANNAIIVFNDIGMNNVGSVHYTTNLSTGLQGANIATFTNVTGDLANLDAVDFAIV